MVRRIMRSRRRFRMILHRKYREFLVFHPLARVVVQIHMRHDDIFIGKRVHIDGETVILRGDVDTTGMQVFYGLVAAVMAEFKFESSSPQGLTYDLMSQTNAKDRFLAQQFFDSVHNVRQRCGVPRTVGQKDPVGYIGKDL